MFLLSIGCVLCFKHFLNNVKTLAKILHICSTSIEYHHLPFVLWINSTDF